MKQFIYTVLGLIILSYSPVLSQNDLLNEAVTIFEKGDLKQGLILINKFISNNPSNADGYLEKAIMIRRRADMNHNQKDFNEALDLLIKARHYAKDKKTTEIINGNFATTYSLMGNYTKAIEFYEIVYKSSGRVFYRVRSAVCYAEQGDTEKAIMLVERLTADEIIKADSPGNQGLTEFNMGTIKSS